MCNHLQFRAAATFARLIDKPEKGSDQMPSAFVCELEVECAVCGQKFEFLGLETGYDTQGAKMSLDGRKALLAIYPAGAKPNPMQRMGYGIKAFNG